ncbi:MULTISPECIES: alpha/beta fold hydrolase [unclassified Mesorhizobium]|uniref:alpha/beta fold hydrolase n=1 Tax=unclassified Mesorhizobium TaxID=325217 RepID=UPI000FCA812B|nr:MULTISPECIES: alpha/beta fold hydrolase [unclassified Mesorhizobium]RUU67479.1 alpha/beta fold hydrolase [Mesorhizobium sp. M7A.T.Ca.TU.009.01.1.1]RUU90569.1 alpha/beta fold hydrolase [Mesorhizobium sp. M7A.T.Ca.TU.009.01.1.2]RUT86817.1 alpha/beta fold hydrolase [Mesorhizobium sp. M7A.T.Ca.US.000.02.2.1]RUT89220.1 alpha/beta fold hydrolase [Mesorhizobium sp. M7A.T.Ca.US.000.02.1.1]RUU04783.1 alpha/beta fold hydrolase [Mesorhizobium sp. M7A.T.Ca.TU.009.02.1.1]
MADASASAWVRRGAAPDGTGFIRVGAGAPVLFIHGVGMNAAIWQPQIERMSDSFDVIAIDMLGHGQSPLPPQNPELADYADQAIRLLDHLGLDKVSVIGHSMGALVAQELALRAAERVRRIVSLNAVFRRPPELAEAVRQRAVALTGKSDVTGTAQTIARWFGDPVPVELEAAARKTAAVLGAVDPEGYARTYRLFARADSDHADRLPRLAVPALFMTGSEDRNSSPAMSAAMARLAPHGRCTVLSGERHMMAVADPGLTTRHIVDFLKEGEAIEQDSAAAANTGFDGSDFRRALGSFLTGVTIVTTIGPEGEPRGFTANSFTSVSLDPPLVLVCIAHKAVGHPVFATSKSFAINVLNEDQKAASGIFASKAADKFAAVAWRPGRTGSPVLDGSVASFDCDMERLVDAGDHSILIGRVRDFEHNSAQPLGYCRGAYVAPGLSQDALAATQPGTDVGAILENGGRILFLETADGFELPRGRGLGAAGDGKSLRGVLAARAIEAKLGFLFAVWDDARDVSRTHVYYRGTFDVPASSDRGIRLVEIHAIEALKIADPAIRSMLARYVKECSVDAFGVYVGNDVEGEVRPLARTAGSTAPNTGDQR